MFEFSWHLTYSHINIWIHVLLSACHYCSLAAQDDEKWTLSQYMQCTTGFLNTPKTDRVANFVELGHVETCSECCLLLLIVWTCSVCTTYKYLPARGQKKQLSKALLSALRRVTLRDMSHVTININCCFSFIEINFPHLWCSILTKFI